MQRWMVMGMYEPPIHLFVKDIVKDIVEQQDAYIVQSVRRMGVDIDKEELLRALQYDRGQYEKGYADGKADAMASIVRCKDCVHWYGTEGVCLKIYSDGAVSPYAWQDRNAEDFCSYGERRTDGNEV